MLHTFEINICATGSLGLRLSRAPWDPYPWVSSIQRHSSSYEAGLRVGDTVLKLNGCDVLGLKISEIAKLLQRESDDERTISNSRKVSSNSTNSQAGNVKLLLWRNKNSATFNTLNDGYGQEDEINNAHNINQQSLQKFATCLQHIAQLLECPVCLEVIKPPGWQCCNGHVLCNNCRSRSVKCPVCRVPLGPRGRCLLSDKLFHLLAESFPCDGVRKSAHVSKCSRPCSKNEPRMGTTVPTALDEQQTHLKPRNPSAHSVNDIL